MSRPLVLIIALLTTGMLSAAPPHDTTLEGNDGAMAAAATTFLEALRPKLRERAMITFDDPNRLDWHYIPRGRRGVPLKEMNDTERMAAHALLRSALSSRGYLKTVHVMELESVLRGIESRDGREATHRDPELYFVTVFGEPGGEDPWGWRFEGHHVSLNFSSVTGEVTVTPAFFGANPAEVRSGEKAGLRVLWDEESLARRLLGVLTESQRAEAVIESDVPADVLLSPGNGPDRLGEPQGLPYAAMDQAQRELVEELLGVWAGNLEPGLCRSQLARIRAAGLDGVRFLWIGSDQPGRPHYYRLQGPTFVIEYDNTQNIANHIHTSWRDLERDFGADLLREHLMHDHAGG